MMMIPKSGRRGFANCMVSRPSLDRVLNRLCSLEPADGQVGDNFKYSQATDYEIFTACFLILSLAKRSRESTSIICSLAVYEIILYLGLIPG